MIPNQGRRKTDKEDLAFLALEEMIDGTVSPEETLSVLKLLIEQPDKKYENKTNEQKNEN